MKHYNIKQWEAYINNSVGEAVSVQMEEHLLTCNICLETYLSVLEKQQNLEICIKDNNEFIDKVMAHIKADDVHSKPVKKPAKLAGMLVYYAAAACMTLFFTINGGFQYITDNAGNAANSVTGTTKIIENVFVNGWTEKLSNQSTKLLDRFEKE